MVFLRLLVLMCGHLAAIKTTSTLDIESEEFADIPDAVYASDAPISGKDTKIAIETRNDYLAKNTEGGRSWEVSEEPKAPKTNDGDEDPRQLPSKPDTVTQNAATNYIQHDHHTYSQYPDLQVDKGCHGDASVRHLSEIEETIEWKGSNLSSICTWLIEADPQYGIVLQFLTVFLRRGYSRENDDSLTVYRYKQGNERELRRVVGDLAVPPVVEYTNRILIRLVTHKESADQGQGHACTNDKSLRLGYKRFLLHELPPEVRKGRYNCSMPYIVPEALRCDMVMQCIGGEDELNYNCTYHEPHCEKGSVYRSFHNMSYCLKLRESGCPGRYYRIAVLI
ncbi:hypothetical protein BaRGS_00016000 [Batillaria attramentaria]|uniref:CUB domain-containing protein n=1 Tax=Batillaria attramentaria TaxID=370345 RepID=A0ABD0KZN9_9CAEN